MALDSDVIEEWKNKKYLNIDGYRSTSLSYGVAKQFATLGRVRSKEKHEVILQIKLENKHSKYYICLDREDYTMYLEEKEVLLQAGLVGKVEEIKTKNDGKLTIFKLFISDEMV